MGGGVGEQAWAQQEEQISDLLSNISEDVVCLLVDFWVVKSPSHIISKSALADALARAAPPKTENRFFLLEKRGYG